MPQEHIKRELEELRDDLQLIDTQEGATPEEIQRMLSNINKTLDGYEDKENHDTLLEHMQEAIVQFEVDHPQFAGRIRGIIDGLSLGGI